MQKIILLFLFIQIVSCAHSIKNNLESVSPGMTRSDVVDLLGSPVYVDRNNVERHIWDYRFYDESTKSWAMKSVVFENDVVFEVTETKEKEVVLKNIPRGPVYEEYMDLKKQELIKRDKALSNQDWLEEIQNLQKESLEKEKAKTIQTFKEIR